MTRLLRRSLLTAVSLALISCVTTIDGIWVSGRHSEVSPDDIRQVIAACRLGGPFRVGRPRQIDVINRDEIHVYWAERKAVYGGHDIAKRVRGHWICEDTVIITS